MTEKEIQEEQLKIMRETDRKLVEISKQPKEVQIEHAEMALEQEAVQIKQIKE